MTKIALAKFWEIPSTQIVKPYFLQMLPWCRFGNIIIASYKYCPFQHFINNTLVKIQQLYCFASFIQKLYCLKQTNSPNTSDQYYNTYLKQTNTIITFFTVKIRPYLKQTTTALMSNWQLFALNLKQTNSSLQIN